MHYKHHIGLHLPVREGLQELVNDAVNYDIAYFQFFLSRTQQNNKIISFTPTELATFLEKKLSFNQCYIHSSYWINAATGSDYRFNIAKTLLKKEIMLAKKLQIPYLVLHPGSATWHKPTEQDPLCRQAGIEQLATMLNYLTRREDDVMILLENTAHGGKTIGSDLQDLYEIKQRLDFPDKVGFCFDTAHAFAYGYDIDHAEFYELLDKTMGFNAIKLIHFNDSAEPKGSYNDRHALPGTGLIGKPTLQNLLNLKQFTTIPKIIEVTNASIQAIQDNLLDISGW